MAAVRWIILKLLLFNYRLCYSFCYYDENDLIKENNSVIYLIGAPTGHVAQSLNRIIQEKVPCMTFIELWCEGTVEDTINVAETVKNVINIHVPDFNPEDYNDIKSKVIYAGILDTEGNKNNDLTYTKLISAPVKENEDLYRLILTLNETTSKSYDSNEIPICGLPNPVRILLCVEDNDFDIFNANFHSDRMQLSIITTTIDNCDREMGKHRSSLFAVVASKPFETYFEVKTPIIFYNHPFISQDDMSMFPNSLTIMKNSQLLPHAMMAFMKRMEWRRVAILSDDSPYSEEFETGLRQLFDEEKVAYITKKVGLDLEETIAYLYKVKAKIVILNIDEASGQHFYEAFLNVQPRSWTAWIVRDWPFNNVKYLQKPLQSEGQVYTVSLNKYTSIQNQHTLIIDQQVSKTRIDEIITIIKKCLPDDIDLQLNPRNTYTLFRHAMKNDKVPGAYVHQISYGEVSKKLRITIFEDKFGHVTTSTLQDSAFKYIPLDRPHCLINKNNYLDYCGEQELLYLMLVLIGFSLTILVITVFFNHLLDSSNSYSNL